jgi:hypothetical protein
MCFFLCTVKCFAVAKSFDIMQGPHSKTISPLDAVDFPANPTYAQYHSYSDDTCTTLSSVVSVILDTCLADQSTSFKYSCGMLLDCMVYFYSLIR